MNLNPDNHTPLSAALAFEFRREAAESRIIVRDFLMSVLSWSNASKHSTWLRLSKIY